MQIKNVAAPVISLAEIRNKENLMDSLQSAKINVKFKLKGSMFSWYYKDIFKKATAIWRSVFIIIVQEFSLPTLFKTLFAPWRRDIAPPTGSIDEIFRTLLENLISRFVGFCVRFFTILTGCLALLGVFLLGVLATLIFLALPFTGFGTLIVFLAYQSEITQNPPLPAPLSTVLPSLNESNTASVLTPYLEYDAKNVYKKSQDYSQFLSQLAQNKRVLFILNHLGLPSETFLASTNLQIPLAQILIQAAKLCKSERISAPDLFLACFVLDGQIQKFFERMEISKADILNLCQWEAAFYQTLHQPSKLLFPEKIRTTGGVGRLWSAGYTPNLDRFSWDISADIASQNPLHFEAHKEIIEEMETILARSGKHNVILVGEPGTGKRTVALGFASRVTFGDVPPSLAHHRVVEFNIDSLLAGSTSLGETEERMTLSLNEAVRAGNVILFIDNIDHLFEQGEAKPGAIDLSALLLPYLERSDFQLIGTTTYEGYHKWIEPNPNLAGNLEKIEIKEPTPDETLKIIQEVALYLEAKYNILILYPALTKIVSLSEKYLGEKKFPEKAIDLLDEVTSFVVNQKRKQIIAPLDVEQVISAKTHIPVSEAKAEERKRLINLEEILHQRLVNQEEAVKEIAEALRRARAGLKPQNKPIGSFMFLGPTGVGKTECAKTLAEAYFGNENQMLRFDMSEYQETAAIPRLIGSKLGEPGILASRVREKPFSLLLLDEIEKAHPNILNLFLQVLDEGRLTDSMGRTVDFKNTIIIATSNAGSEWIREQLQKSQRIDSKLFIDYLLKMGLFKPEFLNRFDAVIAFRPLSQEELEKVVEIMLGRLSKQLAEKQIKIEIEENAKRKLAAIGFDPEFGARALRRVIQEKVENQIAKAILENKLQPGSTFVITEKMVE